MVTRLAGWALLLVALPGVARAQEPNPLAGAIDGPPPKLFLDQSAEPVAGPWRTDLLVGFPIALRAQRQLFGSPLWVEGGGGLFAIIPTAFAGARWDAVEYGGETHCLLLRPGLDVYYLPPTSFGLFGDSDADTVAALDVDVLWRARWAAGLHGQLGVKVGAAYSLSGSNYRWLPIAAVLVGWQF